MKAIDLFINDWKCCMNMDDARTKSLVDDWQVCVRKISPRYIAAECLVRFQHKGELIIGFHHCLNAIAVRRFLKTETSSSSLNRDAKSWPRTATWSSLRTDAFGNTTGQDSPKSALPRCLHTTSRAKYGRQRLDRTSICLGRNKT